MFLCSYALMILISTCSGSMLVQFVFFLVPVPGRSRGGARTAVLFGRSTAASPCEAADGHSGICEIILARNPTASQGWGPLMSPKHIKFTWFGDRHRPTPCDFIGFRTRIILGAQPLPRSFFFTPGPGVGTPLGPRVYPGHPGNPGFP